MRNLLWMVAILGVIALTLALQSRPGPSEISVQAPQKVTPTPESSALQTPAAPTAQKNPKEGPLSSAQFKDLAIAGIHPGMSRTAVLERLGQPDAEARLRQGSNTLSFNSVADDSVLLALGNHPEIELKGEGEIGQFYKKSSVLVGYASDKVQWVYGPALTYREEPVKQALDWDASGAYYFSGSPASAVQGYCMDGPWAFACLQGHLEVFPRGREGHAFQSFVGLRAQPRGLPLE